MKEALDELQQAKLKVEIRDDLRAGMGEHNPDAIVIIDRSGLIRMMNAATVKFFGYSREELFDQEVEMLLPERFREDHRKFRIQAWKDQKPRDMGNRTLLGMNKSGDEFEVDIQVTWPEFRHGIFGMAVLRKPRVS